MITQSPELSPSTPSRNPRGGVRRHPFHKLKTSRILLWAALVVLLVIPSLAFLLQAFVPKLFNATAQGSLTQNFQQAFSGPTFRGIIDSLWISTASAILATIFATILAYIITRTNAALRRVWSLLIWATLLVPTYLMTEGWQRLLEPSGVLSIAGINASGFYHVFFGPVGVVIVLTISGIPFSYLVIAAGMRGIGSEFEDAARIFGASRMETIRAVLPILAPALLSSLAIVFAESMSDFGVASTLAASANFPVATYTLYNAINAIPLNFGVAAAISWVLVASAAIPIVVQARALKGRVYQVISSRRRQPKMQQLSTRGQALATGFMVVFFLITLGVPGIGVISASLLSNFGASYAVHALTLQNYVQVFRSPLLFQPLALSTELSLLTATAACVIGVGTARMMTSQRNLRSAKVVDLILLGSVALPGIVLAAGYIFTYNLPTVQHLGLDFYGTTKILILGYLAGALPSTTRLLVAPVSQVQSNIADSARVHGSKKTQTWLHTQLPLLAQPILWAWLLTFAKTVLELPISQLLYAPSQMPISVAINKLVAGYEYGTGTAMSVVALFGTFLFIALALGIFRLVAPKGWRAMDSGFIAQGDK